MTVAVAGAGAGAGAVAGAVAQVPMILPLKGSEDVSSCGGIQARGGLVHEQQGRLGHQLQTNVHPLTLPSTANAQLPCALARCLIVEMLM